jgi:hypothetical protein
MARLYTLNARIKLDTTAKSISSGRKFTIIVMKGWMSNVGNEAKPTTPKNVEENMSLNLSDYIS